MVTVSNPRCGCAPTPRRFEVGSKLVGPPKSSNRKGENAAGLWSYEKMLRTGKPSPTQWPCGLRWMWDTDFIVGSPFEKHCPPGGAVVSRAGTMALGIDAVPFQNGRRIARTYWTDETP